MMARLRRWKDSDAAWLGAALLWLAATAWLRPLTVPDEGRYAGVAREMLAAGEWLTPLLDGFPYFHKPPLYYWISLVSFRVFGLNEFAARIAPLAGGVLAAAALFIFVRRHLGRLPARFALAALVTQPLVFISAQYVNLDMLVAGCIAATITALADAALRSDEGRPAQASLMAGYVFAALGVLAKGMIGFVLPALVIGTWLLLEGRWRVLLRLLWVPGLAAFLLVAAPWFIAMEHRHPGFGHYFFVVQHFQRYAQAGFNSAQPAWFFLAVLGLLGLPWSLWAIGSATVGREHDRPSGSGDVHRRIAWLMAVWLVLVTLFFSIPNSKLVGYVLPAAVPLAYFAGDAARRLAARSTQWRRAWRASAGLAATACVAVALYSAFGLRAPQRDIGVALRGQVASGERVVFIEEYWFAVPFYARLADPPLVVTDWQAAGSSARDNWGKELLDAAQFAPCAHRLLTRADLSTLVEGGAGLWLVGSRKSAPAGGWPSKVQERAASNGLVLWHVAADAAGPGRAPAFKGLSCPGMPNANSAGTSSPPPPPAP